MDSERLIAVPVLVVGLVALLASKAIAEAFIGDDGAGGRRVLVAGVGLFLVLGSIAILAGAPLRQ